MKINRFFTSFLTPFNIFALIIFLGVAWLRGWQNQQRHLTLEQSIIAVNNKISAAVFETNVYFLDKSTNNQSQNGIKLAAEPRKLVLESNDSLAKLRKVVDELQNGPTEANHLGIINKNAIRSVFINDRTAVINLASNWLGENGGLSTEILGVCSIVNTVLQDKNLEKVRFIADFPSDLNLNKEFNRKDC